MAKSEIDTSQSANSTTTSPTTPFTSRYLPDPHNSTQSLAILSATWEGVYTTWQQTNLRSKHSVPQVEMILGDQVEHLDKMRHRVGRFMGKTLAHHPLSSWLPPGLRGPQVCRVLGMIGDPWRFPGKKCTEGHHMASYHEGLCGARVKKGVDKDGKPIFAACGAEVGEMRRGTGVRALWHYLGLHVTPDGELPKKRKGVQATWNPKGRTAVMMPQGVADQIIMRKISPWREIYDEAKDRIQFERGETAEADVANPESGAVGVDSPVSPLPPWRVHAIARTIAVKAFLGDMLMEWKRVTEEEVFGGG